MAISVSGVGSPFTLNLQEVGSSKINFLESEVKRIEGTIVEQSNKFQSSLREFDKDIGLGLNLISNLRDRLDFETEDLRFEIGNLQDLQAQKDKELTLDFETKMQGYLYQQEQAFLNFQQDFNKLSFEEDRLNLRLQKDIDVLTAQIKAQNEALDAEAKGNKAYLRAQIDSLKEGQRTQRQLVESLRKSIGLVERQGAIAIQQAGLMGRLAYIQQRTAEQNRRFSRYNFEEARAVNRATQQAQMGFAESPLMGLAGEQQLGAKFEQESVAIVADIESAKTRRQQATLAGEQSKLQTKLQKEGIGRQIIQSKGREKQLGYSIEGYKAKLNAIDEVTSARKKANYAGLEIKRQYAKDLKERAGQYYGSAKGFTQKLYGIQKRQIDFGKRLTEQSYILAKSRNQIEFDEKFRIANNEFSRLQNSIKEDRIKLKTGVAWNSRKRWDARRKYEAEMKKLFAMLDKAKHARMQAS